MIQLDSSSEHDSDDEADDAHDDLLKHIVDITRRTGKDEEDFIETDNDKQHNEPPSLLCN